MFNINKDKFTRAVAILREKHGVRGAGRLLKVNPNSIYNYLSGDTLPNKMVVYERLAEHTNISILDFFTDSPDLSAPDTTVQSTHCKELFNICDSLPEELRQRIVDYAGYIREKYNKGGQDEETGTCR